MKNSSLFHFPDARSTTSVPYLPVRVATRADEVNFDLYFYCGLRAVGVGSHAVRYGDLIFVDCEGKSLSFVLRGKLI